MPSNQMAIHVKALIHTFIKEIKDFLYEYKQLLGNDDDENLDSSRRHVLSVKSVHSPIPCSDKVQIFQTLGRSDDVFKDQKTIDLESQ
jgi:hypothetical protein